MTKINWLQEVEARKEALFADLFRLLKVPSVREDDKATPEAPVGPGPKAALEEFLNMAQEDGFETKQFGPWAGRVEVGSGDQLVGILGHVDVVPVGTGWDTDPFEPVVKDGRIYARGSSDDKGPTVAAYFALKLLRELGLELNQRLHLIVGTDEESGWQCMDYYFNVSATFNFQAGAEAAGANHLVSFEAGLRENMVPQDATAVVESANLAELVVDFESFLLEHQLGGQVQLQGNQATFSLIGKAAHGSTPSKGVNAATFLAKYLHRFEFDRAGAESFLHLLADHLHRDFEGVNLGVAHRDPVMQELTMNVGLVNYRDDKGGSIVANFRYPKGTDPEKMAAQTAQRLAGHDLSVEWGEFKEPHYVSVDDPMVKELLAVYEEQTGLEGHEMTIGGGTYGRLMPRGVAYGALFPDSIDTMHQANEFIAIDDLLKATAIYAEAIYRITR